MRLNKNIKVSNQYNMNGKRQKAFKYLAIADKITRKMITEPIMLWFGAFSPIPSFIGCYTSENRCITIYSVVK